MRTEGGGRFAAFGARPWVFVLAAALLVGLPLLLLGQASDNEARDRSRDAQIASASYTADIVARNHSDRILLIRTTLSSLVSSPRPADSTIALAAAHGDVATLRAVVETVQRLYPRYVARVFIAVRGTADTIDDATVVAESSPGTGLVGQRLSDLRGPLITALAPQLGQLPIGQSGALSQVYSAGPALPSALVAAASVQGPSADAQTQRITSPAVIAAELDINRIFLDAALPSLGPGDDAYNLDPDHRLIGRARGPIAYPLMDLSGDPFVALVSPSTPRVARAGVPDPLGSGSRVVASAPFPLSATYSFVVSRDTSQEDRELEAALGQRANLRLGIVAALLALAYFIGNATKQSTLRAVYEERLRLARDLHDLLGHSLSVITLKAQVARRSLGSGDAGRGATEIAEIERVARESLQDVRGAIDGYRQPSFGSALAGARAALAAAGIDSSLENAAGPLPIAVDA
ncbi:MAG TPA: histidine kinase dimerization/phosphoacceptor domain-containing protein, partial [Candidatus Limnocylindria bacterium]